MALGTYGFDDTLLGYIQNVQVTLRNLSPQEGLLDSESRSRSVWRHWEDKCCLASFSSVEHCTSVRCKFQQTRKYTGVSSKFDRELDISIDVSSENLEYRIGDTILRYGKVGDERRQFFIQIATEGARAFIRVLQRAGFVSADPTEATIGQVHRMFMLPLDVLCGYNAVTTESVVLRFLESMDSSSRLAGSVAGALALSSDSEAYVNGTMEDVHQTLLRIAPSETIIDMKDRRWIVGARWESKYFVTDVESVEHCSVVRATLKQAKEDLGTDTVWDRTASVVLMASSDGITLNIKDKKIVLGRIGDKRRTLFTAIGEQGAGWYMQQLQSAGFVSQSVTSETRRAVARTFMRLFDELCGFCALTSGTVIGRAIMDLQKPEPVAGAVAIARVEVIEL